MNVKKFLFVVLISTISLNAQKLTDYVDPFIGTDGHGHTYPGAVLPFGMMQLSPDTGIDGWDWCSGYHYSDSSIMGFSHTHLSGTGATDYGDILLMPTVGQLKFVPGEKNKSGDGYRSNFTHSTEKASPGYYTVFLEDYKIKAELTVAARSGLHKYTYPRTDSANIIIDLRHGLDSDCFAEIKIAGNNCIEGFRKSHGWAHEHTFYFVAEFSKPFTSFGTVSDGKLSVSNREAEGNDIKGFVSFAAGTDEAVMVKIGISAVSIEGARKNLDSEIQGFDFDKIRKKAEEVWEAELNKIVVESKDADLKKIFYTALYHCLITPNLFMDTDGQYFGMDRKVHTASGYRYYTVFSLWDTFRAEHPLFTIIDPKRAGDFVQTLLAKYTESGLLPVWELASNETWCMIGYHSIPVIFDAYMKGIRNFDPLYALKAMKVSAERESHDLKLYRERGYIPADKENESVSKTLEYSYDDWCISQFAKILNQTEDYKKYNQRSLFFMNSFDKSTGFMRGKMSDGSWITPFEPKTVTQQYTEANAWQYNFSAPQDIKGLIDLQGGNEKFVSKLDGLFSESNKLEGRFQPDISGMIGQYAHGNEPSHHIAYLYDYAGAPWKTQERVRDIMSKMYTAKQDGLCGNDDCGQMSAWYVFSAIGFYPVTPGQNTYAIGSPLFEKVTINLENGKKFIVRTENVSDNNKYIVNANLNGKDYDRSYITHQDLISGGELLLEMNKEPNKVRGLAAGDLFSMRPVTDSVFMPYVTSDGEVFFDSLAIKINCETPKAKIRYTIDGSEPDYNSTLYSGSIVIRKSANIKAFSYTDEGLRSFTMTAGFIKAKYPPAIYKIPFHERYNGGGSMALTDGRFGTTNFQNGEWQGFEGDDLDATIDLTKQISIKHLSAGFLNNPDVWVFLPRKVEYFISDDGKEFKKLCEIINDVQPENTQLMIKRFDSKFDGAKARYVRVHAVNIGRCPAWHKGAGGKAWLFADEVVIE